MMRVLSMFRSSAKELKSPRSLAVTGILIALYVILNTFAKIEIPGIKMTFNYLSFSAISMLYGPCVSALAAIPCDLIAVLFEGKSPAWWLLPSRIAEAFIYGLFFYNLRFEKNARHITLTTLRIVGGRLLAMGLCYQFYNTQIFFYIYGMSADAYNVYFISRLAKNALQFPFDLILLFTILPAIAFAYRKTAQSFAKERKNT